MVNFTYVAQGITVEFNAATSNFDRSTGDQLIEVVVTTDDEQRTQYAVTVEVIDLLTGSAQPAGDDYTFSPNPKVLNIAKGSKSGSIHTVTINIPAGSDTGNETVDLGLQNPTLSALGTETAHEVTINNAVPAQTVTFEFILASYFMLNDFPKSENIGVRVVTSDGNALAIPASVEVHDLLTGSAATPGDYTMTTPQTLNWSAAEADMTVKNATVNLSGANGPTVAVNVDLQNPVGGTEGGQNTAVLDIQPGGA